MIKFEISLPYSQELQDQITSFIEGNETCTVQDEYDVIDVILVVSITPQWENQIVEFTTLARELAEFLVEMGYDL